MKKVLDLNAERQSNIQQATTWSFYFEGERYFEGTRALATAGGVEKPFLNAYRIFAHLGERRLDAVSDAAFTPDNTVALAHGMPEEIDVLASRSGDGPEGRVAVVVWRHVDDQFHDDETPADVTVEITGLAAGSYVLEHYRIDAGHSNAHTVWKSLGSPQDPTPSELEKIKARQGLEQCEPTREVTPVERSLRLTVALALPAVSLLILEPRR